MSDYIEKVAVFIEVIGFGALHQTSIISQNVIGEDEDLAIFLIYLFIQI